jgi:hypothetical protein
MSESGIKVAVFGGNGLVGRQLAAHLGTLLFYHGFFPSRL